MYDAYKKVINQHLIKRVDSLHISFLRMPFPNNEDYTLNKRNFIYVIDSN